MPLITCVLRNKCGKFAVPLLSAGLLSAGLTVAVHLIQAVILLKVVWEVIQQYGGVGE